MDEARQSKTRDGVKSEHLKSSIALSPSTTSVKYFGLLWKSAKLSIQALERVLGQHRQRQKGDLVALRSTIKKAQVRGPRSDANQPARESVVELRREVLFLGLIRCEAVSHAK